MLAINNPFTLTEIKIVREAVAGAVEVDHIALRIKNEVEVEIEIKRNLNTGTKTRNQKRKRKKI